MGTPAADSDAMKNRRRTTARTKHPSTQKASGRRKPSIANADTKIALLERERDEALEQKTALSEVLRLISTSPSALRPVLESVAAYVARICEAQFVDIFLVENNELRDVAWFGELKRTLTIPLGRSTVGGRSIHDMRPVHVYDLQNAGDEFPRGREIALRDGHRTILGVPLIREGRALGTILVRRTEVRPFEQKHIDLVTNFAAQAVIAIENTRLLNELRESLQQQTATADVLKVISSSPGELEPVFTAMLENATRICQANFGNLWLYDDDSFRMAAMHGEVPAWREYRRRDPTVPTGSKTPLSRIATTKRLQHVVDVREEAAYVERYPTFTALVDLAGARTLLGVPMLKDGELIGVIAIYRQEVQPFTDKQIELVQNFAAQAVIAIENTRLLNELRERTDDLTEFLEQQTATSEVLSVISSSPGELQPVFQAMLENATRICEAKFGILYLRDGEGLRLVAAYNVPPAFAEARRDRAIYPAPETSIGQVLKTRETAHVADAAATRSYVERHPATVQAVEVGGVRTAVSVPLLKDNELVGVIAIYRQEVRPFTDKQVALLTSFAAQAVIAVENTRLLNELRQRTDDLSEALEQQTATSEVLGVISSSPGELEPVFQAMLANAVRICEAKFGSLYRFDGENFHFAAEVGTPLEYATFQKRSRSTSTEIGHSTRARFADKTGMPQR